MMTKEGKNKGKNKKQIKKVKSLWLILEDPQGKSVEKWGQLLTGCCPNRFSHRDLNQKNL